MIPIPMISTRIYKIYDAVNHAANTANFEQNLRIAQILEYDGALYSVELDEYIRRKDKVGEYSLGLIQAIGAVQEYKANSIFDRIYSTGTPLDFRTEVLWLKAQIDDNIANGLLQDKVFLYESLSSATLRSDALDVAVKAAIVAYTGTLNLRDYLRTLGINTSVLDRLFVTGEHPLFG